jgi:hypothetical protein
MIKYFTNTIVWMSHGNDKLHGFMGSVETKNIANFYMLDLCTLFLIWLYEKNR